MTLIKKRPINKRAIVSVALLILYILLPLSGKILQYYSERGERSSSAWDLWWNIHLLMGFLFTLVGVFHIVYNWKTLKKYLVQKKH